MQAKKRQVFNLSYLKQNKITPSSAARTSIPKSTLLIYSGSPFCFTSPLRHAVNSSTRNANAIYAALNKIPLAADISNFNTLLARIKIPKAMYMLWQKLNSAIAISCFVTTLSSPTSAPLSISANSALIGILTSADNAEWQCPCKYQKISTRNMEDHHSYRSACNAYQEY